MVIHVDFTRLTNAGYGTIYGTAAKDLQVGQVIAITDADADTIEAEVIEVCGEAAKIRAHWDKVLHAQEKDPPLPADLLDGDR
jgi:hypothetical protein